MPTPQEIADAAKERMKVNGIAPASAKVQGDAEVAEKTFHNRVPGSSFVMPDGSLLQFDHKGELKTKDPRAVAELEAIADKPGCPVFYKNNSATPAPGDKEAAEDVKADAARVIQQLNAQQNKTLGG